VNRRELILLLGGAAVVSSLGAHAQQAERELAQGHLPAIDTAAITSEMSVLGRFLVTRKESDIASFKTPGLRNIVVTGPYFHDGSMQTLWDVMDHYNKGDGITDPWLDKDMQPLALSESEIDDVVALLASLTSRNTSKSVTRSMRGNSLHPK